MAGIECPHCGCNESVVTRTLDSEDGIRRYRKCFKCGQSFPTGEQVDPKKALQIERNKALASQSEVEKARQRFANKLQNQS